MEWMINNSILILTISILVDGSLEKEFIIPRGLRQGELIVAFLFLIVVQNFILTNSKSKVDKNNVMISLLQFVDDALFLVESSIEEYFELVLGVKINFYKSIPIGKNSRQEITWKSIMHKMCNKLVSWCGPQICPGGDKRIRISYIMHCRAPLLTKYAGGAKNPICSVPSSALDPPSAQERPKLDPRRRKHGYSGKQQQRSNCTTN
ncbi:hypothetical protein CR513_26562, partial [Mucuna pruriens]